MSVDSRNATRRRAGRHFLQVPGPSNVPDRILRSIDMPVLDHRGPDFQRLTREVIEGLKTIFRTKGEIAIYAGSGTAAWEAALANTMSPGDKLLMCETGQFGALWHDLARRLGFDIDLIVTDWRRGADVKEIEKRLTEDKAHKIKAVCVVHNETSTGAVSDIPAVRKALDKAGHPAMLFVDAVSSLASLDYRHDEWGVDVTVSGSQKGLMLPPGLGFNAIGPKALAANKTAKMPRAFFDWGSLLKANETGFFPQTPATNLLYGVREAVLMLHEEGLEAVFARHARHGAATRAAAKAWGLDIQCADPAAYSDTLTAVRAPEGVNADELRKIMLEEFDISLGAGLGKVAGKLFRIGHLGDFNDTMLCGAIAAVEMGLEVAGIPFKKGGVDAAMAELVKAARGRRA